MHASIHAIYKYTHIHIKCSMLSITLPQTLSIPSPKQAKKNTPIQVHAKKAITTHHPHKPPPPPSLTTQSSSPSTTTTTFMATTSLIINPKTTTITIICTSVTLLLVLCYKTITRWLRQRCPSLPPGPAGVPIFGNLLTLHPELHTHFATLAKTHGPIFTVKLGNRLAIVISGVEMAKEVLRLQDDNFANRIIPAAAKTMEYITSNIVSSPNGPTLRLLRKICVREMLGKASLDRVYWLRRREMKSLLIHFDEMAGEGVDVGAQMFLMAMNVITSMLWGGVVEGEEKRKEVGKEFREVVGEITEMLGKPNLSDFFPRLERFDVQGIQKKMKEKLVRLDGIFEKIIEERKNNGGNGHEDKDFLGFMLRMEEDGSGVDNSNSGNTTPFTINHVKALLMDMVVGGTETTSNTVEWAMAELIQKPEMMKRAQQELEQVVGKDNMVEESHLPKLTYLGAVIKEVLRLHPALPLLVPHCPSSACTINGYTIPQGSQVFVNVWAIHRDPAIWENPLEFKPERFLGIDGSKWDFTGNDFRYFPFGSGRRICAGISMAERIVGYALASLLHSFDWNLPEGTELDLSERFGIVLKKAKPLVAVPTPRISHEVLHS